MFRVTDNTVVSGAIGVGVNQAAVGGRVGVSVSW
jgi:hypothetical protein